SSSRSTAGRSRWSPRSTRGSIPGRMFSSRALRESGSGPRAWTCAAMRRVSPSTSHAWTTRRNRRRTFRPRPSGRRPRLARGEEGGRTQRIVALGVAGGAVVALGIGAYFGIRAYSLANDADPHCDASGCDPDGVTLRKSSLHAGDVATVSFVAAGVLAGAAGI